MELDVEATAVTVATFDERLRAMQDGFEKRLRSMEERLAVATTPRSTDPR